MVGDAYVEVRRCSERLVLAKFLVALSRVNTDLLVVLLKGRKILTSLGKLTLLHTLTDVPVNKGTLGVHEVELVVWSATSVCLI